MRILAIIGSNRRGNTYSMVESACQSLNLDFDVEMIHLSDFPIDSCDGCLSCDESGKCHKRDCMGNLVELVVKADGLIIASPSRWGLLSGELKVFFDRLNPLAVKDLMRDKPAIVFVVGQSDVSDLSSIDSTLESIQIFLQSSGIQLITSVRAYDCLKEDDVILKHPEFIDDCRVAAEELRKHLFRM